MKKIISIFCLLLVLLLTFIFRNDISSFLLQNIIYDTKILLENPNNYEKKYDYAYIQRTTNYYPNSKSDILNILYNSLNSGYEKFSYICSEEYKKCIDDSKELMDDQKTVSAINNFIHPYNSFNKLLITINSFGKVTIEIEKLYTPIEIETINLKVDQIYNNLIKDDMSPRDKILKIHDYIINNTVYDTDRNDYFNTNKVHRFKSSIAYGPLLQGYAICGGYSDAMAIFLNKMNIPNYKVASQNHVWNFVLLDNKWYHLDLTWDDPVLISKENILTHNFFLITSDELIKKNTEQHTYDFDVYIEAKKLD